MQIPPSILTSLPPVSLLCLPFVCPLCLLLCVPPLPPLCVSPLPSPLFSLSLSSLTHPLKPPMDQMFFFSQINSNIWPFPRLLSLSAAVFLSNVLSNSSGVSSSQLMSPGHIKKRKTNSGTELLQKFENIYKKKWHMSIAPVGNSRTAGTEPRLNTWTEPGLNQVLN